MSLYEIEHLGKEYIRLKLIEDKHKSMISSLTHDIKYAMFFRRYVRYQGIKDKSKLFKGTGL